MAFNNPRVPWSEVERIASGRAPVPGDGNDAPAWSRKREGYAGAPEDLLDRRGRDDGGDRIRAPYAELHVHSNFSFLDGASHPETLVEEAARLELDALVLTDHDGMYGAVRFNDAARELGVRGAVEEAEVGVDVQLGVGRPDPVPAVVPAPPVHEIGWRTGVALPLARPRGGVVAVPGNGRTPGRDPLHFGPRHARIVERQRQLPPISLWGSQRRT